MNNFPILFSTGIHYNYNTGNRLLFTGLLLLVLQITFFSGCRNKSDNKTPVQIARADSLRAATLFAALEDSLLAAPAFHADFTITSEGAIVSSLQGMVSINSEKSGAVQASGSFSGQETRLFLQCDGQNMRYGNAGQEFNLPAPEKLKEGILLGFTRMGFLHNLAMLAFGEPPDKTDGTIRQWIACSGFQLRKDSEMEGLTAIYFLISTNEKPVGDATLWLDANTGLPVRREQTVHFDQGDMNVVEIYKNVNLIAEVL